MQDPHTRPPPILSRPTPPQQGPAAPTAARHARVCPSAHLPSALLWPCLATYLPTCGLTALEAVRRAGQCECTHLSASHSICPPGATCEALAVVLCLASRSLHPWGHPCLRSCSAQSTPFWKGVHMVHAVSSLPKPRDQVPSHQKVLPPVLCQAPATEKAARQGT